MCTTMYLESYHHVCIIKKIERKHDRNVRDRMEGGRRVRERVREIERQTDRQIDRYANRVIKRERKCKTELYRQTAIALQLWLIGWIY